MKVKLIIPGAVDTEIWDKPDEEGAAYDGPKAPAAEVAADIAAALDDDGFEYYLPDMKRVAVFKTQDIDTYLRGSMDLLPADRKDLGSMSGPSWEGLRTSEDPGQRVRSGLGDLAVELFCETADRDRSEQRSIVVADRHRSFEARDSG